jgi:hypothetical protein
MRIQLSHFATRGLMKRPVDRNEIRGRSLAQCITFNTSTTLAD